MSTHKSIQQAVSAWFYLSAAFLSGRRISPAHYSSTEMKPNQAMEANGGPMCAPLFEMTFHTSTASDARSRPPSLILVSLGPDGASTSSAWRKMRMLARLQFGISEQRFMWGYSDLPQSKGYPWRRNPQQSVAVHDQRWRNKSRFSPRSDRLRLEHPEECLSNDDLWSDTEKANGVARDRETGTLCYTIGIRLDDGKWQEFRYA